MKKLLLILLAMTLVACDILENKEDEVVEATPEPTPEVFSIWAVEPGIDIDGIKIMKPFDKKEIIVGNTAALLDIEKVGYPQEWHDYGYDTNAIIVAKDGNHGIYNYDAEMVYPITVSVHSAPFASGLTAIKVKNNSLGTFGYGSSHTANRTAFIMDKDYISVTDVPYEQYDYDPYGKGKEMPFVAKKDGVIGVVSPKNDGTATFEAYNGGFEKRSIIPVVDASHKVTGYELVDAGGNSLGGVVTLFGNYIEGSFINDFYAVGTNTDKALIRASTAQQIGLVYQDVGYFSNGFCPVKKYGKWGYIDEAGNEASDFIFDTATELYEGKAYVRAYNQYGIIDFKKTREAGEQINIQSAYYANPEEEPIGTAEVLVTELTLRTGPSPEYTYHGNSYMGARYKVYEIQENSGMTWYRITDRYWIGDYNHEWVNYIAN